MTTSIRLPQIVRIVLIIAFASLLFTFFSDSNESNLRKPKNFRRPKFQKKPTQNSAMASQYLKNIANRRTIYALSKESTISNDRVQEILTEVLKHTPSSFNNQAGRAVLLVGSEHDKLWEFAAQQVKEIMPAAFDGLKPKIDAFKAGYGTIMFFEDAETMKTYKATHPGMPFDEWSRHAQGMLHVHTWDALELEGLGANLQHYNAFPGFQDKVLKEWNLPSSWELHAQLVFGKPTGQPREKTQTPIEQRLKVFGA